MIIEKQERYHISKESDPKQFSGAHVVVSTDEQEKVATIVRSQSKFVRRGKSNKWEQRHSSRETTDDGETGKRKIHIVPPHTHKILHYPPHQSVLGQIRGSQQPPRETFGDQQTLNIEGLRSSRHRTGPPAADAKLASERADRLGDLLSVKFDSNLPLCTRGGGDTNIPLKNGHER